MWAGTALTAELHRQLSVDFAQTILEIASVMLLPGLHGHFERGVDRFSRLVKFRSVVGAPSLESAVSRLFWIAAPSSGTRSRAPSTWRAAVAMAGGSGYAARAHLGKRARHGQ
jgi:hypothetical protein